MAKKDKSQDNLQKYLTRIQAAELNRDGNYKDLWARCYKRWRNHVDPIVDKNGKIVTDRSNISIPFIFSQVETILPRLVETLFASRPYVTLLSRQKDYDPNAKIMETLLDWQMNERFDCQDKFHTGLKNMVIYGTTVGYVSWKYSEKKVIQKVLAPATVTHDVTGEQVQLTDEYDQAIMDWQAKESISVDYDDPHLTFLDLGLFFVDPKAENIDDARYCGHTCYESKEFLQAMEEQGYWKIDWKKLKSSFEKDEVKNYRMSQVGLNGDNSLSDDNNQTYKIDYYWEDDKFVVLINRCHIALDTKNPFWHKKKPYCKDVYTRVPGEFYGMGVVEELEDLQDEANTERNQRTDFRSFGLRRMFKVRRGANINKNQLAWKQGGIIEVDEMDDVQEFKLDPSVGNSFMQESTIKQDMKDVSGAQDIIMGMSSSSETATTTMSKDNNASARFKLIISSVEKTLLVGIARLMVQLNQQFIDNERVFRVTGKDEWVSLTPGDIQGEFNLIAAGSSVEPLANKEAHKQRMVELYGLLVNSPMYQQHPQYQRNLLKKVLESFDIRNVDDLLPTDQELAPPQLPPMPGQGQPPQGQPSPMDLLNSLGNGSNTALQQEQGMQMHR